MAYNSSYLYFDDLELGQEWESGGRTVTESDIINFAGFSGDFNAIHVDREYAATTPYRKPIMHGFGVFCIASGLTVICPAVRTVALMEVRQWNFLQPVYPGDTIHMKTKVLSKTVRGRGRRGEVVWQRAIVNQDKKVVQDGLVVTLVECRPHSEKSHNASANGAAEHGHKTKEDRKAH